MALLPLFKVRLNDPHMVKRPLWMVDAENVVVSLYPVQRIV